MPPKKSMPPKKRTSVTRSSSRAKRSRQTTAPPAAVLADANEVPASNAPGNGTLPLSQPDNTQSNNTTPSNNPSNSCTLDITSLVTAISASVIQGLKAAGISTIRSSSNSTQVTEVTNNEVASLTGLSGVAINSSLDGQEPPSSRQSGTFSSIAISLGSRVPDKLKHKIWADQYIDLGLLLSPTTNLEPTKYSISAYSDCENGSSKLSLEPVHKPKRIGSIGQWASAFNTFVAVYTVTFPSSAPALMKYCEIVRDLANKQGNWRWYDEQFRFLRQSEPKSYPWDQAHWELWFQSLPISQHSTRLTSATTFNRSRTGGSAPFPKGFCCKFHSGDFCGGCKFKHSCHKCFGSHPGSECRANNSRVKQQRPVVGKGDASAPSKPAPTQSSASYPSKG